MIRIRGSTVQPQSNNLHTVTPSAGLHPEVRSGLRQLSVPAPTSNQVDDSAAPNPTDRSMFKNFNMPPPVREKTSTSGKYDTIETETDVSHDTPNNVPGQVERKKSGRPAKNTQAHYGDRPKVGVFVEKVSESPATALPKRPPGRPRKYPLAIFESVQHVSEEGGEEEEPATLKRPRGRPPKHAIQVELAEEEAAPIAVKRSRGRPSTKHSAKLGEDEIKENKHGVNQSHPSIITPKRGPGRPSKYPKLSITPQAEADEEETSKSEERAGTAPAKRGRGRPPKNQVQVHPPKMVDTSKSANTRSTFNPVMPPHVNYSPRNSRSRLNQAQQTQHGHNTPSNTGVNFVVKEIILGFDLGNGVHRTLKLDMQKDVKDTGRRLGLNYEEM